MIRKTLVLMAVIGAMFAFGSSAANAQACIYDGSCPPTTTKPGTVTTTKPGTGPEIPTISGGRGETLNIDGEACAPGAEVVVTWDDGTVLGTFTADDNGDFTASITVPADATLGVHLVTATCGDHEQFVNVNVLGDTDNNTVDEGTIARTGSSNTGPLVGIGAAALVLGGAFLYGARRPRQA